VPNQRGSVYLTAADHALVIVSRTGRTGSVLVVELRAKNKLPAIAGLPAVVETGDDDPLLDGYILADYISVMTDTQLAASEYAGDLSPATLARLNGALAVAVGLV
jgi:mRNA interferase MazF